MLLRKVVRWVLVSAIIAVWVITILDVSVWRHLTGPAVVFKMMMAAFLSVSLAYLAAAIQ